MDPRCNINVLIYLDTNQTINTKIHLPTIIITHPNLLRRQPPSHVYTEDKSSLPTLTYLYLFLFGNMYSFVRFLLHGRARASSCLLDHHFKLPTSNEHVLFSGWILTFLVHDCTFWRMKETLIITTKCTFLRTV